MTGAYGLVVRSLPELQAAEDRKLNVLFIMSDQHNARALGCYGNSAIKTPGMDRLAREGVRFPHAFCQTGQCCPSRMTILTGRYAHSHGVRWNNVVEPEQETTIAEIFRDASYSTATIGKHHMMSLPRNHGFDHVADIRDYNQFVKSEGKPSFAAKGDWLPFRISGPVGASHADNDHHPAGFWANEAIKFLREHKDKPFCAWLSFYGPHTPITPSKPCAETYDPANLSLPPNFSCGRADVPWPLAALRRRFEKMSELQHRQTLAYYYGLVSQIDHNIGRVLDELDRLGLAGRTIVVYTTDHGEMMAEHHCWTKATLCYDATVRVPMIIRLPGVLPAGKVVGELVGLVDLMPTLCELTGQRCPPKVQGRSMVRLMKGEAGRWRKTIFSEIGYPGRGPGRCVMARTHTHKYVHHENKCQPFEELFDLQRDPWETKNEVHNPKYAEALADLKRGIERWEKTTGHAPMYPVTKAGA